MLKLFAILASVFIASVIAFAFVSPVIVTVRNDSDQPLDAISVRVQNRVLNFPELPPGSAASRWFHNTGADSSYLLSAVRKDGVSLAEEAGYVTSGSFRGAARFTVVSSGKVTFSEAY